MDNGGVRKREPEWTGWITNEKSEGNKKKIEKLGIKK